MAGKKTIVRQAELRILASADHESIMLIEGKIAAGLGARNNMQSDTHFKIIRELRLAGYYRKKCDDQCPEQANYPEHHTTDSHSATAITPRIAVGISHPQKT